MNNRKRNIWMLLMAVVLLCVWVVVLPYSVNDEQMQDKTPEKDADLEFYQQREEAVSAFAAVLDGFHQEHPEYSITQNQVANALVYLTARMQRDDMPDLFTHWPTQMIFRSAVEAGKVLSLENQPFLKRVDESALEICRESSGEVYALPINRNCMEIYYNKELFRDMGLTEPRTIDEFSQLCETLQDSGVTPLIFYLRDGRTAHVAQMMLAALNDDYLTRLHEQSKGTISKANRQRLVDTFRRMRSLYVCYSDCDAGHTYFDACESFARGECAMLPSGSYALSVLRKMNPEFEMGVFTFPGVDPEKLTVLTSIDTALCIAADSNGIDQSLAFLEYLTRQENIAVYLANDGAPSCILDANPKDPVAQSMQKHIAEYENVEWIKSRYSLESCLVFEDALCSYMISGDEDVLLQRIVEAFQTMDA